MLTRLNNSELVPLSVLREQRRAVLTAMRRLFCPGTVSVEEGRCEVVGKGTSFFLTFAPDSVITVGTESRTVLEVTGDTTLLTSPWFHTAHDAPFIVSGGNPPFRISSYDNNDYTD